MENRIKIERTKRNFIAKLSVLLMFMLCLVGMSIFAAGPKRAAAFAGGLGTADDPYLISTQAQLQAIDSYATTNSYFKLTNDIALSGNFTAIGTSSGAAFRGTIDGDGYTVSGLKLSNTAANAQANFGFIRSMSVGGLYNLSFEDVVIASTKDNVGGLVGNITGAVTVYNCSVTGSIDAPSATNVGGLFGSIGAAATISETAFNGRVNGSNYVGGVVGQLKLATIKDSFAVATVNAFKRTGNDGTGYAGGFVGNAVSGSVKTSYTSSRVSSYGGRTYAAPFTGYQVATAYENAYFNVNMGELSNDRHAANLGTYSAGAFVVDTGRLDGVTGLSDANLRLFASTTTGFDTVTVWRRNEGYNNDFPLFSKNPYFAPSFSGGEGTPDAPYLITNQRELQNLAFYGSNSPYFDTCFALANDITISGEWTPIGTGAGAFRSRFDGRGYTVYGSEKNITMPGQYVGLFGYVTDGAEIKNLNISGLTIEIKEILSLPRNDGQHQGYNLYGGAIARVNNNVVLRNVHVKGGSQVYNINNRVYTANLYIHAGGVVGAIGLSIVSDCSSSAAITLTGAFSNNVYLGGAIGYNLTSSVTRIEATGTVNVTNWKPPISRTLMLGGAVGRSSGALSDVYASTVMTVSGIQGAAPYVNVYGGGIIGQMSTTDLLLNNNLVYNGALTVTGGYQHRLGAIVGLLDGTSYRFTIDGAVAAGTVKSMSATSTVYNGEIANSSTGLVASANGPRHKVLNAVMTTGAVITCDKTMNVGLIRRATRTVATGDLAKIATYTGLGFNAAHWRISSGIARIVFNAETDLSEYFSGGSGTANDPYQISTARQLQDLEKFVGADYSDVYYILRNDINLGAISWNWMPIGSSNRDSDRAFAFQGHLDGNGKTVLNLNISTLGSNLWIGYSYYGIGLFGSIYGASISNLTIKNPVIEMYTNDSTTKYIGGLVGYAYMSEIRGCAVINDSASSKIINGHRRHTHVGGLVGYMVFSGVYDSYATVPVTAWSGRGSSATGGIEGNYQAFAGGLVGNNNNGIVERSYASGAVLAKNTVNTTGVTAAGGLVAYTSHGRHLDCYALGSVETAVGGTTSTAIKTAGGIVGYSTGAGTLITRCYAAGNVKATTAVGDIYAGGIVGYVATNTSVTSNNVAANISVTATTGSGTVNAGSVGGHRYVGTATIAYANNASNSGMVVSGSANGVAGNLFTLPELKQKTVYERPVDEVGGLGWDFQKTWSWSDTVNLGFPTLKKLNNIGFIDFGANFAAGVGSKANPYLITTESELVALQACVGAAYEGMHFKLNNDITLTRDWIPVGDTIHTLAGTYPQNTTTSFMGKLDGGGHAIKGFKVNGAYANGAMFTNAYLAEIKNLTFIEPEINASAVEKTMGTHAVLVGWGYRTDISNVHIRGGNARFISEQFLNAGAIVGYGAYMNIVECSVSDFKISATAYAGTSSVGGLIGTATTNSLVARCYADVEVETNSVGTMCAAALIGRATGNMRLVDSYALGKVDSYGTGTHYVGGIVGYAAPAMIKKCYSAADISVLTPGTLYAASVVGQSISGSSVSDSIGASSYIDASSPSARSVSYVGGGTLMSSEGNIYYLSSMAIDASGVGMSGTAVPREALTVFNLTKSRNEGGFDLKWDFDNTWAIDANINNGLPYLKSNREGVIDRRSVDAASLESFLHLPDIGSVTIEDKGQKGGLITDFGLVKKLQYVQDIIVARNASVPGSGDSFVYLTIKIEQLLARIELTNTAYGAYDDLKRDYESRSVTAGNENKLLNLRNKLNGMLAEFGTDGELRDEFDLSRPNLSVTQRDLAVSWIETLNYEVAGLALESIDGNGLKSNPFIIRNEAELMSLLLCLGEEYSDSYWVLNNDIRLSGEWVPIGTGTVANAFWGNLDGNGYTISGLKITQKFYANTGLFGYTTGAQLSNITIESPVITPPSYNAAVSVGALVAATNADTIITNCHVIGGTIDIKSNLAINAGGLVGYIANGSISGSSAGATVNANQYNYLGANNYAGGLVGNSATSSISASYATGNVTATTDGEFGGTAVGGLVGITSGETLNSYATGNVTAVRNYPAATGVYYVLGGGIAGHLNGASAQVESCYALGAVTVRGVKHSAYAGGIAGAPINGAQIRNSLALNGSVDVTTGSRNRFGGKIVGATVWQVGAGASAADIPAILHNNWYANDIGGNAVRNDAANSVGREDAKVSTFYNSTAFLMWDSSVWRITTGSFPTLRSATRLDPGDDFAYNTARPETRGSESNPYLIDSAEKLQLLNRYTGVEYKGVNWKITRNLALSGEWAPIGQGAGILSFYGNVDGGGYTISGLNVKGRYMGAGLFGYVYYSQLKNIVISAPDIYPAEDQTVTTQVGALVGYANAAIIEKCSVVGGSVKSNNDRITYAGGLFGTAASSKIIDCKTTAVSVTGKATSEVSDRGFGGLGGHLSNSVAERLMSSSTVTVQNMDTSVGLGGLFGYGIGEVRNCYATGKVSTDGNTNTGTVYAGGLIGAATGKLLVEQCYASGDVDVKTSGTSEPTITQTGVSSVGGLIGSFRVTAIYRIEVRNCVAANASVKLTGAGANYNSDYIMGLKTNGSGTMIVTVVAGANYYNSGMTLSPARTGRGVQGTGKTIAVLKTQSTYTGLTWNFDSIWLISANSLPVFKTNISTAGFFGGGTGTANDPYIISTAAHLGNLRYFTGIPFVDTYWSVVNDIALSGEWTPIGSNSGVYAFNGNLDGGGHKITGLKITTATSGNYLFTGLFGYTERATVKELTLVSPFIEHKNVIGQNIHGGAFVGCANTNSSFYNCKVQGGSVSVENNAAVYAGGFAGLLTSSSIDLCSSTASVRSFTEAGHSYVGGFAGSFANSAIERCFSSGAVSTSTTYTGAIHVGGLAGLAPKKSSDSYATGSVTASTISTGWVYAGGLFGYTGAMLTVENCYASGSISVSSTNDQSVVYVGGILGRTAKTALTVKNSAVLITSVNIDSEGYYAGHIVGYQYATDLINNFYTQNMKFYRYSHEITTTDFSGTGIAKAHNLFTNKTTYFNSVSSGGLGWNTKRIWKDALSGAPARPVLRASVEYNITGSSPDELRALFDLPTLAEVTYEHKGSLINEDSLTYKQKVANDRYVSEIGADKQGFKDLYDDITALLYRIETVNREYTLYFGIYLENYDGLTTVSQIGDESGGMVKNRNDLQFVADNYRANLAAYQIANIDHAVQKIGNDLTVLQILAEKFGLANVEYDRIDFDMAKTTEMNALLNIGAIYDELTYPSAFARFLSDDRATITQRNAVVQAKIEELRVSVQNFNRLKGGTPLPEVDYVKIAEKDNGAYYTGGAGGLSALKSYLQANFFTDESYAAVRPLFGTADAEYIIAAYSRVNALIARIDVVSNSSNGYTYFVDNLFRNPDMTEATDRIAEYRDAAEQMRDFSALYGEIYQNLTSTQVNNFRQWVLIYENAADRLIEILGAYDVVIDAYDALSNISGGRPLPLIKTESLDSLHALSENAAALKARVSDFAALTASQKGEINAMLNIFTDVTAKLETLTDGYGVIVSSLPGVSVYNVTTENETNITDMLAYIGQFKSRTFGYYDNHTSAAYKLTVDNKEVLLSEMAARVATYRTAFLAVTGQKAQLDAYDTAQLTAAENLANGLLAAYDSDTYQNMTVIERQEANSVVYDVQYFRVVIIFNETPKDETLAYRYSVIDTERIKITSFIDSYGELWTKTQKQQADEYMLILSDLGATLKELNRKRLLFTGALKLVTEDNIDGTLLVELPNYTSGLVDLIHDLGNFMAGAHYDSRFTAVEKEAMEDVYAEALALKERVETPENVIMMMRYMYDKLAPYRVNYEGYLNLCQWLEIFNATYYNDATAELIAEYDGLVASTTLDLRIIGKEIHSAFFELYGTFSLSTVKSSDIAVIGYCYTEARTLLNNYSLALSETQQAEIAAMRDLCCPVTGAFKARINAYLEELQALYEVDLFACNTLELSQFDQRVGRFLTEYGINNDNMTSSEISKATTLRYNSQFHKVRNKFESVDRAAVKANQVKSVTEVRNEINFAYGFQSEFWSEDLNERITNSETGYLAVLDRLIAELTTVNEVYTAFIYAISTDLTDENVRFEHLSALPNYDLGLNGLSTDLAEFLDDDSENAMKNRLDVSEIDALDTVKQRADRLIRSLSGLAGGIENFLESAVKAKNETRDDYEALLSLYTELKDFARDNFDRLTEQEVVAINAVYNLIAEKARVNVLTLVLPIVPDVFTVKNGDEDIMRLVYDEVSFVLSIFSSTADIPYFTHDEADPYGEDEDMSSEYRLNKILEETAPGGALLSRLSTYNALYAHITTGDHAHMPYDEIAEFVAKLYGLFGEYNTAPYFNMTTEEIAAVEGIIADVQFSYASALYLSIDQDGIAASEADYVIATADELQTLADRYEGAWGEDKADEIRGYGDDLLNFSTALIELNVVKDEILNALPDGLTLENVRYEIFDEDNYDIVNGILYAGGLSRLAYDVNEWLTNPEKANVLKRLTADEKAEFGRIGALSSALAERMYAIHEILLRAEDLAEHAEIDDAMYETLTTLKAEVIACYNAYNLNYSPDGSDNISDEELARFTEAELTIENKLAAIKRAVYEAFIDMYDSLLEKNEHNVRSTDLDDIVAARTAAAHILNRYAARLSDEETAHVQDIAAHVDENSALCARLSAYLDSYSTTAAMLNDSEAMAAKTLVELAVFKAELNAVLSTYDNETSQNMTDAERAVIIGGLNAVSTELDTVTAFIESVTGALDGVAAATVNGEHLAELPNYATGIAGLMADVEAFESGSSYRRLTDDERTAIGAVYEQAETFSRYLDGIADELDALSMRHDTADATDYAALNALLGDVRAFIARYTGDEHENLSAAQQRTANELSSAVEQKMLGVVDGRVDAFIEDLKLPEVHTVKTTDRTVIELAIIGLSNIDAHFGQVLNESHVERLNAVRVLCDTLTDILDEYTPRYLGVVAKENTIDGMTQEELFAYESTVLGLLADYAENGKDNMTAMEREKINGILYELEFKIFEGLYGSAMSGDVDTDNYERISGTLDLMQTLLGAYRSGWKTYQKTLATQRINELSVTVAELAAAQSAYEEVLNAFDESWTVETVTVDDHAEILAADAALVALKNSDCHRLLTDIQKSKLDELGALSAALLSGIDEVTSAYKAIGDAYAAAESYESYNAVLNLIDAFFGAYGDLANDEQTTTLNTIITEIETTVRTAATQLEYDIATLPMVDSVKTVDREKIEAFETHAKALLAAFAAEVQPMALRMGGTENLLTDDQVALFTSFATDGAAGLIERIDEYEQSKQEIETVTDVDVHSLTIEAIQEILTAVETHTERYGKDAQNMTPDEYAAIDAAAAALRAVLGAKDALTERIANLDEYLSSDEFLSGDFTLWSRQELNRTLDASRTVENDLTTTIGKYDEALTALDEIERTLVSVKTLRAAAALGAALKADEKDYTSESWAAFVDALNAVDALLSLSDKPVELTQQAVERAEAALNAAVEGLVDYVPTGKTILEISADSGYGFFDSKYKPVNREGYVFDPDTAVYLLDVADSLFVADVLSCFTNERSTLRVFKKDTEIAENKFGSTLFGTGMTVRIYDGELLLDSVTIVVKGDINGDGKINTMDKMSLDSTIKNKTTLSEVQFMAADITRDGKVNTMDKMRMDAHIKGSKLINEPAVKPLQQAPYQAELTTPLPQTVDEVQALETDFEADGCFDEPALCANMPMSVVLDKEDRSTVPTVPKRTPQGSSNPIPAVLPPENTFSLNYVSERRRVL